MLSYGSSSFPSPCCGSSPVAARINPKSCSPSFAQVGEHTDFGSITVLFNRLAGLRIVEPGVTNAWEDWPWVPPKSNHAIINLGDAMVKLTNGLFRSNVHRVDPPPSEQASAARFSLVYFSRPRDDVLLKRVQGSELIPALGEGLVRFPLSRHVSSSFFSSLLSFPSIFPLIFCGNTMRAKNCDVW